LSPRRPPLLALAALLCAAVLAGCLGGDDSDAETAIEGRVLTIYSSLPASGPSAAIAEAVAAGQRQALADARGRAGRYRIRFVQLSSTKPGSGDWDPGQVDENASRAARDPRTIAYLGELNLGGSAVSVPVTNEAGILQVSPGDGLTSLTRRPPGRAAAGPERYYPSEGRTFVRLVPDDLVQAELIVERMQALGVERPALVVGSGVYERELAGQVIARAREAGIEPVEAKELRDETGVLRDVPRELAELQPDAVVLAISRDRGTAALLSGFARTLPQARLLTGSGVLVGEPLAPAAVPPFLEAVAAQPPDDDPSGLAQRAMRRIARDQDLDESRQEMLAGYESVRLVLDAVRAAQRGGEPAARESVVREALAGRERRSVLGTYEVHGNGTVEGLPLALWRLRGGRFEFVRTLR
jgi:branched-chain amino acid transport system substrate-binding protein